MCGVCKNPVTKCTKVGPLLSRGPAVAADRRCRAAEDLASSPGSLEGARAAFSFAHFLPRPTARPRSAPASTRFLLVTSWRAGGGTSSSAPRDPRPAAASVTRPLLPGARPRAVSRHAGPLAGAGHAAPGSPPARAAAALPPHPHPAGPGAPPPGGARPAPARKLPPDPEQAAGRPSCRPGCGSARWRPRERRHLVSRLAAFPAKTRSGARRTFALGHLSFRFRLRTKRCTWSLPGALCASKLGWDLGSFAGSRSC